MAVAHNLLLQLLDMLLVAQVFPLHIENLPGVVHLPTKSSSFERPVMFDERKVMFNHTAQISGICAVNSPIQDGLVDLGDGEEFKM